MATLGETLAAAERRLRASGIPTPRLDAEVLLLASSGLTRVQFATARDAPLEPSVASRFAALVERRARREAVAYLVGEKEFWSLPLAVGPGVLVPRPETESVVEVALRRLESSAIRAAAVPGSSLSRVASGEARRAPLRVIDVGTGSGAIALALSRELARSGPGAAAVVVGIDASPDALRVAAANAARHAGPGGARVRLVRGDLVAALAAGSVDLVVSNPPYLSEAELRAAPGDLGFEPELALIGGGEDGLDVLRRLLAGAARVLRPGGWVVAEIGSGQGRAAEAAARAAGFFEVSVSRDLAGLDRVLAARRGEGR